MIVYFECTDSAISCFSASRANSVAATHFNNRELKFYYRTEKFSEKAIIYMETSSNLSHI